MKKEINAHIYRTTLSMLEDRVEVYTELLASAQGGSRKTRQDLSDMLASCEQIRANFVNEYRPRPSTGTRKERPVHTDLGRTIAVTERG